MSSPTQHLRTSRPHVLGPRFILRQGGSHGAPYEIVAEHISDKTAVDTTTAKCRRCDREFGVFRRRHTCRACSLVFCDDDCPERPEIKNNERVCVKCISILKELNKSNRAVVALDIADGASRQERFDTLRGHLDRFPPATVIILQLLNKTKMKSVNIFANLESLDNDHPYLTQREAISIVEMRHLQHVASIDDSNFLSGCVNIKMLDLTPLKCLESVGDKFAAGCTKLAVVDMTGLDSLKTVGASFFEGCSNLTELHTTGITNLMTLGDNFCKNCVTLNSLSLAGAINLTTIRGDNFLSGCSSLRSVDLSSCSKLAHVNGSFVNDSAALVAIDLPPRCSVTGVRPDVANIPAGTQYVRFFDIADGATPKDRLANLCTVLQQTMKGNQVHLVLINRQKLTACDIFTSAGAAPPAWWRQQLCEVITGVDCSQLGDVTELGPRFFANCSNLSFVCLLGLKKLVEVGDFFLRETDVRSVDFSPAAATLSQIGDCCCSSCPSLTSLNFSRCDAIAAVGDLFAGDCLQLKRVVLSDPLWRSGKVDVKLKDLARKCGGVPPPDHINNINSSTSPLSADLARQDSPAVLLPQSASANNLLLHATAASGGGAAASSPAPSAAAVVAAAAPSPQSIAAAEKRITDLEAQLGEALSRVSGLETFVAKLQAMINIQGSDFCSFQADVLQEFARARAKEQQQGKSSSNDSNDNSNAKRRRGHSSGSSNGSSRSGATTDDDDDLMADSSAVTPRSSHSASAGKKQQQQQQQQEGGGGGADAAAPIAATAATSGAASDAKKDDDTKNTGDENPVVAVADGPSAPSLHEAHLSAAGQRRQCATHA